MKPFNLLIGIAVALALVSSASLRGASAAVVYDTMTVFDSSNAVIASLTVTEAQQALDPTAVNYLGGVAVDPSQFGNYGVVLAGGIAVDIFGVASGGPDGQDLAFTAGPGAELFPIKNPIADTGGPINLTLYLASALQSAGDTAFFTASGAFTDGVPEPATWAMMFVGFGGLGANIRGWRRRQAEPRVVKSSSSDQFPY